MGLSFWSGSQGLETAKIVPGKSLVVSGEFGFHGTNPALAKPCSMIPGFFRHVSVAWWRCTTVVDLKLWNKRIADSPTFYNKIMINNENHEICTNLYCQQKSIRTLKLT